MLLRLLMVLRLLQPVLLFILVVLLCDIVLVLRRIHNLRCTRLGGPLHTTPTTTSIFSNRVRCHSLSTSTVCHFLYKWYPVAKKYEAPIADFVNQPTTLWWPVFHMELSYCLRSCSAWVLTSNLKLSFANKQSYM